MKSIDARRLLCPMPVIRLQNGIKNAPSQSQIEIICTDPGVMSDIPSWCKVHGHSVISTEEKDGEYRLIIEAG